MKNNSNEPKYLNRLNVRRLALAQPSSEISDCLRLDFQL